MSKVWGIGVGRVRNLLAATVVIALGVSAPLKSNAQRFSVSIEPSTNQVKLGEQVTYTILLTNTTGLAFQNLWVTNSFPSSAQFVNASGTSASLNVVNFTNADGVTFYLQQFFPGAIADLQVKLAPSAAGLLTNTTVLFSAVPSLLLETNVVIEVSAPPADLGVSMVGPASGVLVNDWMIYQVATTNRGPNSAANVMLTNVLPAGAHLLSISPSNQPVTVSNNLAVVPLGTLTNGETRGFTLLVQPTVAGLQTFSAIVAASSIEDTNTANNTAHLQVNVADVLATDLLATNASAMTYNPQTGLMDQTVRLVNVGTSSVPAARVIISGLTNRLYNAVGTNNGNPFVVYGAALAPGQSVDLVMEYFVPTRLPILVPDSAYLAVGVPTNPPLVPPGTPFAVTRMVALPGGNILIEFASIPGRNYTVLYSDDLSFMNALAAQPAIVAPADRTQWIDDGPPKTVSAPASGTNRFYRVLLNP